MTLFHVVHQGNTSESIRSQPGYWRVRPIKCSWRKHPKVCQSIVAAHYATNKGISQVHGCMTTSCTYRLLRVMVIIDVIEVIRFFKTDFLANSLCANSPR